MKLSANSDIEDCKINPACLQDNSSLHIDATQLDKIVDTSDENGSDEESKCLNTSDQTSESQSESISSKTQEIISESISNSKTGETPKSESGETPKSEITEIIESWSEENHTSADGGEDESVEEVQVRHSQTCKVSAIDMELQDDSISQESVDGNITLLIDKSISVILDQRDDITDPKQVYQNQIMKKEMDLWKDKEAKLSLITTKATWNTEPLMIWEHQIEESSCPKPSISITQTSFFSKECDNLADKKETL